MDTATVRLARAAVRYAQARAAVGDLSTPLAEQLVVRARLLALQDAAVAFCQARGHRDGDAA